jgi:hypothetical protein
MGPFGGFMADKALFNLKLTKKQKENQEAKRSSGLKP